MKSFKHISRINLGLFISSFILFVALSYVTKTANTTSVSGKQKQFTAQTVSAVSNTQQLGEENESENNLEPGCTLLPFTIDTENSGSKRNVIENIHSKIISAVQPLYLSNNNFRI